MKKFINVLILGFVFLVNLVFSFILANRRYENFEFGKFDLGNMSQIVWNTSQGRFMEVTDQFGTNMPRWGMSHVDPILAIFSPFYWINPEPMFLVLLQHILIISAIFPLFYLIYDKLKSYAIGYFVVLSYLLYPAIGFTLVWTTFHGISFVAPIFIWLVWFVERNNFLQNSSKIKHILYWLLIIIMLMGKEEIGAIIAIVALFLYFKNKKLAIYTFIVGFLWTLICFAIIIPNFSQLREYGIEKFISENNIDEVKSESLVGDNFFLHRYSYLGNSYSEIALNTIKNPGLVFETVFSVENLDALNNLFGPFGYVVAIIPIWIISIPDLAIVLLSYDDIFDIQNHRIAFVISGLFISYIFFIRYLSKKYGIKSAYIMATIVLILNIYFSDKTNNPIYVSSLRFIQEKIVAKVFAEDDVIDTTIKASIPRKNVECARRVAQIVHEKNPSIYTGPDYLGAHTSHRIVNALFPARYWDAELVVVDIFDTKSLNPLGESWLLNKKAFKNMLTSRSLQHIYSCETLSVFQAGESRDRSMLIDNKPDGDTYELGFLENVLIFVVIDIPPIYDRENPMPFETALSLQRGTFRDKVTFWTFEKMDEPSYKKSFINYLSFGSSESLSVAEGDQFSKEIYYPLFDDFSAGKYSVYYGFGDLANAVKVHIDDIEIR